MIRRAFLTAFTTIAGLLAVAPSGVAAQFKCPHVGGNFTFGQEANINSLDQMTSSTISTRNIAMNMFEALMTRDENFSPILDLAASVNELPDHLTYTFKLRQGVHFHNGKLMTSADVVASFDRYSKVGLERSVLGNVDHWDAPDADTFVIHMKQPQPTFLIAISSFSVPIVIIPAENKDDPPQQLKTIGTGPWQLVELVPGSYVKMKRYEGYQPNTAFEQNTGFGGYKQACFDTVTVRIVTEAQAACRRPEDRRAAGRRGYPRQVAARHQSRQEHHRPAAEELVDPDHLSEHLGAADGQPDVPQGGAGGARHG